MIWRRFLKSDFAKNVSILVSGTAVSQALPILTAPFLTRLYSPEQFGVSALYLSVAAILSVVATARYELAIILPKIEAEATQLLGLSIIVAALFSGIVTIGVFLWAMTGKDFSPLFYGLPLSIFSLGVTSGVYYIFNRKRLYKIIASVRITQSAATILTQALLGFSGFGLNGLMLGLIIGHSVGALASLYLAITRLGVSAKTLSSRKLWFAARKHANFPKFMVPGHAMSATSSQAALLLTNALYASSHAGFLSITMRVTSVPFTLIAQAIGDVFRQEASDHFRTHSECYQIYKSTLYKLVILGLPVFTVFFFVSPYLFTLVFGETWAVSGHYAQIMTPMFFLRFVSSPLANMYLIAGKQKRDLYIQIFILIVSISSIVMPYFFRLDYKFCVYAISFSFSFVYFINIILTIKFSKG